MYSLRDDNHIDVTRHQDLIHQSQQSPAQISPLKTRVARVYRLFLAHAGKRLMDWGYKLHSKSGLATEISSIIQPYAMEKRS